jgi:hypothetical protein
MSAKIKISLENPEIRAIWETVLEARREVASWPAWKRGEDVVSSSDDTPVLSSTEPDQEADR